MLVLAAVLVALVSVPLTGGHLGRLAGLHWRCAWLLPLSLLVQVVIIEVPGLPGGPSAVAHVVTYLLAAGFVVANRAVAGLWLLALGAASNGLAIAANGGVLPSTRSAMTAAGNVVPPGFANTGVLAHPVLGWLGDVFAVPRPVPLANTFSVGDVLIVAGAAWVVHAAAHRRPRHVAVTERLLPARTGEDRRAPRHARSGRATDAVPRSVSAAS